MKIIMTDNFDRDSVPDKLIAENVAKGYVLDIVDCLNGLHSGKSAQVFFVAVKDDHRLKRGMHDLV